MQSRIERLRTAHRYRVLGAVDRGVLPRGGRQPRLRRDPPAKNLKYYVDDKSSIMAGVLASVIALAFLLWFLGSIRRTMLNAEQGDGRVTAISFAGGVVGVGLLLAAMGAFILPALRLDEDNKLTAATATTFMDLGNILFGFAAPIGFGVMLLGVGLVGVRHGAVPKWWAIISVILGIVMLIPFISWAGMGFGFPIWVLVMSILMMRANAPAGAPAGASAQV